MINPNRFDFTNIVDFNREDANWKEFYPEAQEEIPDNCPTPIPRKVQITIFVDADHAHCEVTRRSVSGILVYINSTPIRWYSKMQKTVETSTYGSELVAARIATEFAMEYRYYVRMLGYELDGPVNMLGDNNAVVLNTTIPSSQLKKKHAACSYHRVREMIACRAVRFGHIPSMKNVADIGTKPLGGIIHHRLVQPVLFGDGIPILFVPEVDMPSQAGDATGDTNDDGGSSTASIAKHESKHD